MLAVRKPWANRANLADPDRRRVAVGAYRHSARAQVVVTTSWAPPIRAAAGTAADGYADLTGEPIFVLTASTYYKQAMAPLRITPADSAPSHRERGRPAARHGEDGAGEPDRHQLCVVRSFKGGFSGGTVASILEVSTALTIPMRAASYPAMLSPGRRRAQAGPTADLPSRRGRRLARNWRCVDRGIAPWRPQHRIVRRNNASSWTGPPAGGSRYSETIKRRVQCWRRWYRCRRRHSHVLASQPLHPPATADSKRVVPKRHRHKCGSSQAQLLPHRYTTTTGAFAAWQRW